MRATPNGTRVQSNMASATVGGVRAFGLQLPKSKQTPGAAATALKPKAFAMDDDEEEAPPTAYAPTQMASIRAQKLAREQARVLEENPDAFSYDDLFETESSMKKREVVAPVTRLGMAVGASAAASAAAASSSAAAPAAPSRYISALLSKSASRKLEAEAIYERNLLKERAADDALHEGKEKFVTAAFREQQAQQEALRKQQEEQDRRDEAAERVRAKGGAGSAALALQASRAILEARAGGAAPVTASAAVAAPPASLTAAPTSAAAALPTASSITAAPAAASSRSTSGTKHSRSDSTEGARTEEPAHMERAEDGAAPEAKRAKTSALETHPAASTTATVDANVSVPAAAPTAPAAPAASAAADAADVQSLALAKVAAALASSSTRMSKAEEAKARLLARKQAQQKVG